MKIYILGTKFHLYFSFWWWFHNILKIYDRALGVLKFTICRYVTISQNTPLPLKIFNTPNSKNWKLPLLVVSLLFTLPVSNAAVERLFSLMKRIKTATRSMLGNDLFAYAMDHRRINLSLALPWKVYRYKSQPNKQKKTRQIQKKRKI